MKFIDVVSNTSPLIFLEKIDSLDLLKSCFRSVYISEGVKNEWGIISIPSFISVHSLSEFGKSYVKGAIGRLHKGELEAIQSAIELNCKVISGGSKAASTQRSVAGKVICSFDTAG
ncbi:MAG: hypothetical protein PF482_05815 [Desulfobacteraceae bacterium]|jgi:predicted nucleic acid-binding protein|nr:hypothetical protein [Desulfobacteraceae bacterium]